jgi:hypothetical protein
MLDAKQVLERVYDPIMKAIRVKWDGIADKSIGAKLDENQCYKVWYDASNNCLRITTYGTADASHGTKLCEHQIIKRSMTATGKLNVVKPA